MKFSQWMSFGSVLFILPVTLPAFATVTTGSAAAVAQVLAICIMEGGSINFGDYDPISANATTALDGVGTFSLACTKGTVADISIGPGLNPDHANGTTRAMGSGGGDFLSYDLYTSAGHTTVWSTTNTVAYVSSSKNTMTSKSVWGRIPAGQNVKGGMTYNDIVTVTTSF